MAKKFALLSVSDKTGLIPFAQGLAGFGYELLSTGGTAKALKDAGVPVKEVDAYTQSPEILSGRVKTLHPKIHGGILFDRNSPEHQNEIAKHNIEAIDLVVVNLYPFQQSAVSKQLPLNKAIDYIDIGGPTMLRAAAKNYQHTVPVIDPSDYVEILKELRDQGGLTLATRIRLARKTFAAISEYDSCIADYFLKQEANPSALPEQIGLNYKLFKGLRYGENPQQQAALYQHRVGLSTYGFASCEILQGKELSYNNYLDLDAAAKLVAEFSYARAVTIIKHTNPCGTAISTDQPLAQVFARALACDPKSAFGGIIATNDTIDKATAQAIAGFFCECVIAPDYSPEALDILASKKNLRLLKADFLNRTLAPLDTERNLKLRSIYGGLLVQTEDSAPQDENKWQMVTQQKPTPSVLADLRFAMIVAKHVKSNAIVYAKDLATLGVGAGQMSRIDAALFGFEKAMAEGKNLTGACMASDAFFPFRDTVDFAARCGIKAIIQPGGSMRDEESIAACNEHGIAMVFTGQRHFAH